MFSGIVRDVGTVEQKTSEGGGFRLWISTSMPVQSGEDPIGLGDSISVSGACLTVDRMETGRFSVVVGRETVERTTIGQLSVGGSVNLERCLTLNSRLDGHLVTGHVDGLGTVASIDRLDESVFIWVNVPLDLSRFVATKGSLCIDGVSLTVNEINGDKVRVNIIPYTAEHTTLGALKPGAAVNLEVDLVARYLDRQLHWKTSDDDADSRLAALLQA